MMTNEEYIAWMEKRAKEMTLEELKEAEFLNNMVDYWQWDERVWAEILEQEIRLRSKS